ncbi:L-arabinose transporter permease protein [Pelotomaculum schinkii]|uniref:L-arabinose transporter permease protein n=1 Tax=Pelotomaculum schinkii TaxID=78350 RepID=A0A4Y7RBU2_9FIRM|nr:L-arabinose transporter permease protein [Pelotomaculum schinkii]
MFIGSGKVLGMPVPVIILVIFLVVFGFILARTTFDRSIYMIGGNVTSGRPQSQEYQYKALHYKLGYRGLGNYHTGCAYAFGRSYRYFNPD